MIVTEAEAAAHFCVKTEIRKDIPSETRPEMLDKAKTPFLLADIGGSYFKLTKTFPILKRFSLISSQCSDFITLSLAGITIINSDLRLVWKKLAEWLERLT